MAMLSFELSDEERTVLRALARGGTMSPGKVSAETMILPGRVIQLLQRLADVGLVALRTNTTETADGMLVRLTPQARDLLDIGRVPPMTKR